jgi:hypothetical protein
MRSAVVVDTVLVSHVVLPRMPIIGELLTVEGDPT